MNRDIILFKAIAFNLLIAVVALIFGFILKGPKISIELKTALILSSFLFFLFLTIIIWLLAVRRTSRKKLRGQGLYGYVRYPVYFGVVFLFNIGLAILSRSWLYFLSVILIYFVWKGAVAEEEVHIVKESKDDYRKYRLDVPAIFPKISGQKFIFFPLVGVLVFIIALVALNFPAFYLRYVEWGKDTKIISRPSENGDAIGEIKPSDDSKPPIVENVFDKSNSVVIKKIGVDAPLVGAQSTSQRHLNAALNSGVVVYPGSDRPGERGTFFITGHSSVYPWNRTQYGQVFSLLEKLEAGDMVTVYYDRREYQYRITNKYIKSADDVWLEHPKDESKIFIMTCWPIGTNLKRLIVEGELIKP